MAVLVVRFLLKNEDKPACSLIIRLFRLCIRFAFVECLFNYSYYLFCLRLSERSRMKLDVILQLYMYIIKQIPNLYPEIVYRLFYSINLELKLDGFEFNSQNI